MANPRPAKHRVLGATTVISIIAAAALSNIADVTAAI